MDGYIHEQVNVLSVVGKLLSFLKAKGQVLFKTDLNGVRSK